MSTTLMGLCWPLQMPPTPKAVLISLADNANDQGYCWPSLSKISERTCFGRTAVIDAVKWLEARGALKADRSDRYRTTYIITPAGYAPEQLVRKTNQSGTRTSSDGDALVRLADDEVRETDDEVRQADTNRKEPSLTVTKSNRQKRAPALVDLSKFDFSAWPSEPGAQVFTDWIGLRKKKRADVSETVMRTMGAELHRAAAKGYTVDEALGICVLRGWQGLEAKWLDPKTGGNHAADRNDHRESLAERAERLYVEGEAREAANAANQRGLGHGW
ncbi:hypothetical protein GCM10009552_15710 [Rothia nasimurium]|uniref:Helix-turn-helix domain-containing protein n=1 Tax=Luteibacter anthropi TaxID=564369 RepID=A0A7X5ZIZ1_9GAMM|nr:helix-turn-helix domain-containing protein [Luteibacter anthropi]NII07234.1 helix-turn-helix domain-containing protein [Luteibacter anthropi]